MSADTYSLPQLSQLLGVQYRTLHSWVERGLLQPSVQQSSGTGVPNLFDGRDAVAACVLVDLRAAGITFDLLRQAATQLAEHGEALSEPAFMLINGDVKIVTDANEAVAAIKRGGLTMAYSTATALETVEALWR